MDIVSDIYQSSCKGLTWKWVSMGSSREGSVCLVVFVPHSFTNGWVNLDYR